MASILITVDNLGYTYDPDSPHAVKALRGVSLTIAEGSYVAVIGHNGSGKSTLAKCLNGLLLPTAGSVVVAGMDTRDPDQRYAIRAKVGMVFQNPDNQFVASTVAEEAAFGGENLGIPRDELVARLDQALADTELTTLRDHNPSLLSAGEKARLAIAAMLVMRPACLVLDESTAMLAPQARQHLLALVDRLHRSGLTIVLITHNMAEAAHADHIHILENGALHIQGTPREVFNHPTLQNVGLAPPPAARIAAGLRARGLALDDDVLDGPTLQRRLLALHGARR